MSLNEKFCSGSSTSRSAADGSPRKSAPTLSISSSMKIGFRVPACFIPWMMRPGSAPTYVRRCPRISASSRIPPREIRRNLRPIARAIDFPSEVFPTPGGPTKHRIGPFVLSLSFRTARYSRIRSLTLSRSWWSSSRIFFALAIWIVSFVSFFHGSSTIQSR